MDKVVFVEVQESRGDVTRQPLQEQRVGRLGVALPTAVQVALHVTLRQEGTSRSGCLGVNKRKTKEGGKNLAKPEGKTP